MKQIRWAYFATLFVIVICTFSSGCAGYPLACKTFESSQLIEWLANFYMPLVRVQITEIEVNSPQDDRYGTTKDWVEIQNVGDFAVLVSGWYIEADVRVAGGQAYLRHSGPIPKGTVIPPGACCVVRSKNPLLTNETTRTVRLYAVLSVFDVPKYVRLLDEAALGEGEFFRDTTDDTWTWQRNDKGWAFLPGTPCTSCTVSCEPSEGGFRTPSASVAWDSLRAQFTVQDDLCNATWESLIDGRTLAGYLELCEQGAVSPQYRQWNFIIKNEARGWVFELTDTASGETSYEDLLSLERTTHNCYWIKYCECCGDLGHLRFKYLDKETLDSSLVKEAWFDESAGYLVLCLNENETLYHYCSVPVDVWTSFKECESKGRYYYDHIKGMFSCKEYSVPEYMHPIVNLIADPDAVSVVVEWNDVRFSAEIPWEIRN